MLLLDQIEFPQIFWGCLQSGRDSGAGEHPSCHRCLRRNSTR
jgi:hypothetical protein